MSYTAAIVADWLNWTMQKQKENCDLHDLGSAFVWYPPKPLLSGLISGFIEFPSHDIISHDISSAFFPLF